MPRGKVKKSVVKSQEDLDKELIERSKPVQEAPDKQLLKNSATQNKKLDCVD